MSVLWSSWTTLVSWPKTDISSGGLILHSCFFLAALALHFRGAGRSQSCWFKNKSSCQHHPQWSDLSLAGSLLRPERRCRGSSWLNKLPSEEQSSSSPCSCCSTTSKTLSPRGPSMAPFMQVSFMTLCSQSRGPDIDLHQRVPCIPRSPLLCFGRSRWTQRDNSEPVYLFSANMYAFTLWGW